MISYHTRRSKAERLSLIHILQMQNDLNLNIMDIMQADGVDFAFPSTSVYIEKNS